MQNLTNVKLFLHGYKRMLHTWTPGLQWLPL